MDKKGVLRTKAITRTSWICILSNILIASVKVVLGIITASVAIISEGVNNATDAVTSVLALLGTKLAGKHPDKKHPFGYGRIEYLTGLVISCIILVAGVETLIESIRMIFEPSGEYFASILSMSIIAGSAVIKFLLGAYTVAVGRKHGSGALEAVGLECKGDSFVSIVTVLSAVVYLAFGFSVDAYAGVITSGFIIKAGAEVLWNTVSDLLGRPGEKELADNLYREIRATEGVRNAADLMLHNYGPEAWSGSVNLEIDHETTVGEVYRRIHELQLRIMHTYHVTMVFGIYAVDHDREELSGFRASVADFVRSHEHVTSYHAVYLDREKKTLYVDLVVDYDLTDWDALRVDFMNEMKERGYDYDIELTVETDFV